MSSRTQSVWVPSTQMFVGRVGHTPSPSWGRVPPPHHVPPRRPVGDPGPACGGRADPTGVGRPPPPFARQRVLPSTRWNPLIGGRPQGVMNRRRFFLRLMRIAKVNFRTPFCKFEFIRWFQKSDGNDDAESEFKQRRGLTAIYCAGYFSPTLGSMTDN